jgi:hypothetical protein
MLEDIDFISPSLNLTKTKSKWAINKNNETVFFTIYWVVLEIFRNRQQPLKNENSDRRIRQ